MSPTLLEDYPLEDRLMWAESWDRCSDGWSNCRSGCDCIASTWRRSVSSAEMSRLQQMAEQRRQDRWQEEAVQVREQQTQPSRRLTQREELQSGDWSGEEGEEWRQYQATKPKCPRGWEIHFSKSKEPGRPYWVRITDGHRQWAEPADFWTIRDILDILVIAIVLSTIVNTINQDVPGSRPAAVDALNTTLATAAAAAPECWQAATASYPLCHLYPAHGYTCVGGSCASMDPRGNPLGCAAKAPAGFTVDLATGTCHLTWTPQLGIGTRPPLLPPLWSLVAIVTMMLTALYFKGRSQAAPAARPDQDVTILQCRHLPSSPFRR